MIETTTPVDVVTGIGETIAHRLGTRGVGTVCELLAAHPAAVGRIARASEERVARWRAEAVLLHVEGMTTQRAGALLDAGTATLDALCSADASRLRDAFALALARDRLDEEPTPDEIAQLRVDATRLAYGGSACGMVLTPDGTPVEGASVSLGRSSTRTDHRGRFRLLRLRSRTGLAVRHETSGEAYVADPTVVEGVATIAPMMITLVVDAGFTELSELAGDTFPPLAGARHQRRRVVLSQVEEGDVLVLTEPRSGGGWEAFSPFRRYRAGTVWTTFVRLEGRDLPVRQAETGEAFLLSAGRLTPIDRRLANRRSQTLLRELRTRGPRLAPSASREEALARLETKVRWAAGEGLMKAPRFPR